MAGTAFVNKIRCVLPSSPALGAGWRLGFLGLLHMDVFRQRLEDEHEANLILTAPSVSYRGKSETYHLVFLHKLIFHVLFLLVKITGKKNIQQYGGEWVTVHNAVIVSCFIFLWKS